ncbi:hypothetical protein RHMOL_Rhmol03G0258700 [Rhododendron molle]|uniref:Uncharacterized protein n=2 Tax=Rhododendron molle TaxID=49168 RepID=A0ACC0PLQ0_RHOML|nr:hypothetical protein RHMOL_Rhmol03G0258700 [Rhododendron molle]KAI8565433.1 hypothetical protein RHMOL_Rhmol03G0258700 [Rhododendron molle]
MFILKPCSLLSPHQLPRISRFKPSLQSNQYPPPSQPHSVLPILSCTQQPKKTRLFTPRASATGDGDGYEDEDVEEFSPEGRFRIRGEEEEKGYDRGPEFDEILGSVLDDPRKPRSKPKTPLFNTRARVKTQNSETQIEQDSLSDDVDGDVFEDEEVDEFSPEGRFRLRGEEEKDYDRDPEFAEILGSVLDDPQKAQSKMAERLKKKRNKILHTKTGSTAPMEVHFNKFDFSNSYIWFEFYNAPLEKDISLIRDTLRAWHIVGRLGGCNSMNMQLSQSPLNEKRPSYDAIEGANLDPTTFHNIGDLEIQYNLARVWVDIGTNDSLILDILVNALTQISFDHVGIKQVVFGGKEFENWSEDLMSEDAGYSVHKI